MALDDFVKYLVKDLLKSSEEKIKSLEGKTESLEEEVKVLKYRLLSIRQHGDVQAREENYSPVVIVEEVGIEEEAFQEEAFQDSPQVNNDPSIITIRNSNPNESIGDDCKNSDPMDVGIHVWIAFMMTKQYSTETTTNYLLHNFVMFLLPLLSWIVIIAQHSVMYFLLLQSQAPHCKFINGEDNGDCDDREQICVNEKYYSSFGTDFTHPDGVGTCRNDEKTFDKSQHCPFLVNKMMPASSKFVIVFIFFYIVGAVLHDKEQNSRTTQAARQRASDNESNRWVTINIWCIYILRSYVLPFNTFFAAIMVLYVNLDFRPSEILLNGIAVEVICSK